MPDNDTIVMQMSKPSITYVGGNFLNSQNLYNPAITMTSQQNSSQVGAKKQKCFLLHQILIFYISLSGTVVNSGLVAPSNDTQSAIMIAFRSILISNPSDETNGSQYVTKQTSMSLFLNIFTSSGLQSVLNIITFQKFGLVKHYSFFLI
jgi:hypothetical protein